MTGTAGATILVASAGTGDYKVVRYRIPGDGERVWETRYAPVAIARLHDLAGARALILLTAEAREKHGAALQQELEAAGIEVESVTIPTGGTAAEIWKIFAALDEKIPDQARLVLDITHALRHIPVVYLAALLYLEAARGVELAGIHYGAYEAPDVEGRVPILDVTPILTMARAHHMAAVFQETGDGRPLAAYLAKSRASAFQTGTTGPLTGWVANALGTLHPFVASGLVLEAGIEAAKARETLANVTPEDVGGPYPLARHLLDRIGEVLKVFACEQAVRAVKGEHEKTGLPLAPAELAREIRVARWYLNHGDVPRCYQILRECLVNRVILARGAGKDWLDYEKTRRPAEQALGVLKKRAESGLVGETHAPIAALWNAVSARRNAFAHCSFKPETTVPAKEGQEATALLDQVMVLVEGNDDVWRLDWSLDQRILVTALGLSPGVAYTALRKVKADALVVVTSHAARPGLDLVLARPDVSAPGRRQIEVVDDPHHGFGEAGAIMAAVEPLLAQGGTILVNLAGGTTVMQTIVEAIAREAERFGLGVRRFATVDRRAPEAQRAAPCVEGEVVWLDGDRENDP